MLVPDAEAVEGWGTWSADRRLPQLFSATLDYWVPRRAALAKCLYGCELVEIPGETCSCGFHAAKTLERLLSTSHRPDSPRVCVVGWIACWGKVIEGSQGWRSSKAYPTRLWVPSEVAYLAGPLQRTYGCEVGVKDFQTLERSG